MAAVTDPSIHLLFCEGDLDTMLLTRMVPPGQAEIRSTGGKRSMRAFIQGHLAAYGPSKHPEYLGFRDRDFDIEPPPKQELIRLPGQMAIWLTFRACIESYFVDAELLYSYWEESAAGPNWQYGHPPSIELIREIILKAAQEIAEYQAIRWALAKLKPGSRWPEIETTWTGESGRLPGSLAFDDCLNEGSRLVGEFETEVSQINVARLEESAQDYRHRFTQADFYSQQLFLVWFSGKDLLTQLSRHLPNNFPYKHFAAWAVNHLDFSHFPDLQQLAILCATSAAPYQLPLPS